jgi:hypothetical protein
MDIGSHHLQAGRDVNMLARNDPDISNCPSRPVVSAREAAKSL